LASTSTAATRKRAPKTPVTQLKLTDKTVLTTQEVAELLSGDVSVRTLQDWRRQGLGPDYIAISATMVRYRRAAVDRWLDGLERKTRARDAA
jgi:hypothetical protein